MAFSCFLERYVWSNLPSIHAKKCQSNWCGHFTDTPPHPLVHSKIWICRCADAWVFGVSDLFGLCVFIFAAGGDTLLNLMLQSWRPFFGAQVMVPQSSCLIHGKSWCPSHSFRWCPSHGAQVVFYFKFKLKTDSGTMTRAPRKRLTQALRFGHHDLGTTIRAP